MSVKRKVTVPVGRSLTTQGFRVLVTGANRNLDPAGPVDPVLDEYRPPPCGGAGPQFPSRQQKKQPFAASGSSPEEGSKIPAKRISLLSRLVQQSTSRVRM